MDISHQKQWNFLTSKFDDGVISHAYILAGPTSTDRKKIAKEFTKYIHCLHKDKPCQKCVHCVAIEKEQFPDLCIINREEEASEIEISQIKDIQNFLLLSSYYGQYRVVIVNEAEYMNQEAQSRFLKTLEEPKGKTIIFLITSRPDMILETIKSRCQQISFFQEGKEKFETTEDLQAFLSVINGGLAEKFAYAKEMDSSDKKIVEILPVIEQYFRNELLAKIGVIKKSVSNKEYSLEQLQNILATIDTIYQTLLFTNASGRLALEILLMEV